MTGGKKPGYNVGYKQPPKQHQFQKGQSGNPLGGSRKARAAKPHPMTQAQAEIWRNAGQELISVTINGEAQRIPAAAVVAKRVMADAARGKPTAMRLAITYINRSEETLRESYKSVVSDALEMLALAKREAARLHKLGEKNPLLIPHPDDFAFDPLTFEPMMLGPVSESQHELMMEVLKGRDDLRDLLRRVQKTGGPSLHDTVKKLTKEIGRMDQTLPPRLRMSLAEWEEMADDHA